MRQTGRRRQIGCVASRHAYRLPLHRGLWCILGEPVRASHPACHVVGYDRRRSAGRPRRARGAPAGDRAVAGDRGLFRDEGDRPVSRDRGARPRDARLDARAGQGHAHRIRQHRAARGVPGEAVGADRIVRRRQGPADRRRAAVLPGARARPRPVRPDGPRTRRDQAPPDRHGGIHRRARQGPARDRLLCPQPRRDEGGGRHLGGGFRGQPAERDRRRDRPDARRAARPRPIWRRVVARRQQRPVLHPPAAA